MKPDKNTLIALGQIKKPRGLSGEVIVWTYQPESPSFVSGLPVVIELRGEKQNHVIERARPVAHRLGITFTGIDDRNKSEQLVGGEVYCRLGDLPEKKQGEFFVFDLVGLVIVDKEGEKFGTIREVLTMPANDVLEVEYEGRELIVPFSKKTVDEVNLKDGFIRIDNIRDFILDEN